MSSCPIPATITITPRAPLLILLYGRSGQESLLFDRFSFIIIIVVAAAAAVVRINEAFGCKSSQCRILSFW